MEELKTYELIRRTTGEVVDVGFYWDIVGEHIAPLIPTVYYTRERKEENTYIATETIKIKNKLKQWLKEKIKALHFPH